MSVRFGSAILAAALLLGACSSGGGKHSAATTTSRAPEATTSPRPLVSTRLELSSHDVVAGGSIDGAFVVDNETGRPIRSGYCADWGVRLTDGKAPGIQNALTKCALGPVYPVGISRSPFTVAARYSGCGAFMYGGPDHPALPTGPRCLEHGVAPPLPFGRYRVVLVEYGKVLPLPEPVTVRVHAR